MNTKKVIDIRTYSGRTTKEASEGNETLPEEFSEAPNQ
jgi:hypothetical protein